MPKSFLDRVQSLWDSAKNSAAKTRSHFAVPRDHVDNGPELGPPFAKSKHYLQIVINQMFLAHEREWFNRYDPMVFVATTYIYDRALETLPFVVGPGLLSAFKQEIPQGMIFENTPVTALNPYQGGTVTLTVILNKLERANNVEKLLQFLESMSNAVSPVNPAFGIASYLKIAGTVVDGVESLMGLKETIPVMGYRIPINPQIGDTFEPAYYVIIDKEEAAKDVEKFWIKEKRLCYGSNIDSAKPYRANDFVVFSIAQGSTRTDERLLPFYPLWQTASQLAQQSSTPMKWDEAKANFNALKGAMYASPDLTQPDRTQKLNAYKTELIRLRKEAVEFAELAQAELSTEESEMYAIAKELDALDAL